MEALVETSGAHVVDITFRRAGQRTVVDVFADTEQGIGSEMLADINRALCATADERGWFGGAYTMNVSSPGLDRPLRYAWQYRRHAGREVELVIREGESNATVVGEIVAANDQSVELRVDDASRVVPFADIERAMILISL